MAGGWKWQMPGHTYGERYFVPILGVMVVFGGYTVRRVSQKIMQEQSDVPWIAALTTTRNENHENIRF
jgi:hypothetical protein